MIGSDLLRFKKDQRFFIYDEETESLNLFFSRPWQVSYAVATQAEIITSHVRYIWWPDLKVSADAARITRFDYELYKKLAEPPEVVYADFSKGLYDTSMIPTGHNILGFDPYPTAAWQRGIKQPVDWSYVRRSLDTNCLMKAYKKGWTPDRANMWAWQYRCMNHIERGLKSSLGVACQEFGIDYDSRRAHDAGYDTSVNHKVLKELLWKLEI